MRTLFVTWSCPIWFGLADDVQTDGVSQKLNARIANSGGSTYSGGNNTGLIVRAPDFFDKGGNVRVVPASLWHNDIFSPSQLYPSVSNPFCPNNGFDGFFDSNLCDAGDPGPWEYAGVAVVMSDAMEWMFDDYSKIQDADWGWGVFYASDSNSADKRCFYHDDWSGYDCPGGYIDSTSGEFYADDTKSGAGSYLPGNPDVKGDQGGGGSGCHFNDNAIDQTDSDDPNGNLVMDANCQCNYAFAGKWSQWVDAWSFHSTQKHGFEDRDWLNSNGKLAPAWAMDTAACWVNNPRDMIDLQNALHWQHSKWNNQLIPQSYWGTRESSELRKYWGWNEVPVSKELADDPRQWDAIMIKLPADVCQRGDWGAQDEPSCMSDAAQQQLEQDLDNYVQNGKLNPGVDNIGQRPGSYVVFAREYGTVYDEKVGEFGVNWSREFFCANWMSPNQKYKIISIDNRCYIEFATPVPAPTPAPAPTTTPGPPMPTPAPAPAPAPAPTPPAPSQHGIKNHEEVCLQAEQPPALGQRVTVGECNGSDGQDWNFNNDAITYGDFCLEALDPTVDGGPAILNRCQGNDRQLWETVEQEQPWTAFSVGTGQAPQRCLDVWTDTATNTKGLWIWECNQGDNQKWQLPQTMWTTV